MAQQVEVKVPDIGDFKDVEVIELLVKPGDAIAKDQSLITVESDKASMEIPSSAAGIVKQLMVKLGDKVSKDSPLLMIDSDVAAAPAAKAAPAASAPSAASASSAAPSAPVASGPASVSLIEITVPDIGDFKDVEVIELLIKPGDTVEKDQSLMTVESDKASMEIPSSHAGVVKELKIKLGDKVSKGTPVATLTAAAGAAAKPADTADASAPAVSATATAQKPAQPTSSPAAKPRSPEPNAAETPPRSHAFATEMGARPEPIDLGPAAGAKPHASPSVRKFARELGVELSAVRGSGPKGRITEDDIRSHVKGVMASGARPASSPAAPSTGAASHLPAWPQIDFAKFGPIKRVEMSRIRRISGPALTRNWVTIPHVTNHDDADVTELEAFRVQLNKENEKSGLKLTMLAFLMKACVAALKKFPEFNSSIDAETGDAVILKDYFHIGFAADTPNGLVVPVVKDVDKKGVIDIAQETGALAAKARDGKLGPADMQGGTFSISSLGGIGGTYFTPIINAPEVAILGVCRSQTRPVWDGKQFAPRLILPLSLSWDHRVVDGAGAARFNAYLAQVLADFRRVLL
ncbi:MAG TPA: dihydrolipoyllysine-residue acetyltransferase [Burkholderiaceae bacterium]|nr:dihydrolipoyllysine-residue acetyltransferase [Burkholderiaceae bacterium]